MNQSKPNLVFVLTDQWRAQAFGYAGDPNVHTPNIDALAARSVNFKNAISVCPVCTPQRASLLTGHFPTSTGMFLNDLYLRTGLGCYTTIMLIPTRSTTLSMILSTASCGSSLMRRCIRSLRPAATA